MGRHELTINIAPVQSADIESLVELFLLVERQHEQYWPLRWALRPDIQMRYTRWITNYREKSEWLFITARRTVPQAANVVPVLTNEIIGGLAASVIEEIPIYQFTQYAFIHDLAVRPEARRQGVGHALIDYTRQWAKTKGVNQLRLMAAENNIPARALFAHYGFRVTYTEMVLPIEP
ncbi:MAG: GNAT family N-acetyltransferase [Planctomycetes bacterium]|jgi:GNAT superfamily N-acetyltransferase|nr:GNAT family N-acetyltransferase [Planctomycetota bacterium]